MNTTYKCVLPLNASFIVEPCSLELNVQKFMKSYCVYAETRKYKIIGLLPEFKSPGNKSELGTLKDSLKT